MTNEIWAIAYFHMHGNADMFATIAYSMKTVCETYTLLSVNQSYLECRTDHHPHPQPHKSTTNDNNDYKIYNRRAFIHTQTLNLPSILAP